MSEKKNILLSMNVDISKSIESMAQYEKAIEDVTNQMKALQDKQKSGEGLSEAERAELIRLKEVKKALSKEYGEHSRQVQNTIISEAKYKDTLKGLCAELSIAKDKLRAMKEAGSPDWQKQAAEVNELNEKIKGMEEQYGVHTRNVGNYSKSFMEAFSAMGGSASKIINPLKGVTGGLKAMSATPVIAIVGLLVNLLTSVIQKLQSSEENINATTGALSAFGAIGDVVTKIIQGIGAGIGKLAQGFMNVLDKLGLVSQAMKERQAIAKAEADLAIQQRETITANADAELKIAELKAKSAEKLKYTDAERVKFLEEAAQLESEIANRAYEDAKREYEIIKDKNSLAGSSVEEKKAEAEAYAKMINAQTAYFNKTKELNSQLVEAQKAAADKAYTNWEKTFNAIQNLHKALLASRATYLKDWSLTEEENAAKEFEHNQRYALLSFMAEQKRQKELLKQQLAYGKITATAYQQQMAVLAQEFKNFQAEQANALYDFQKAAVGAAIETAGGKILDRRLDEVRTKYKLAEDAIRNDAEMSEEEKSFYLINLAKNRENEIKAVKQDINDKTNKYILQGLNELYDGDMRQFSANQEERLTMEIERLQTLIAEKKKANLSTLDEEAQLANTEYSLRESAMNRELAQAWKSADEQYRIKRKFIEDELKLESLSAEQRANYEKELAEMDAAHNVERINRVTDYANQAMEIMGNLDSIMSSLSDRQVAKAEQENKDKKASLDNRLKAGLISQEQYDRQVETMDADLDKKKAEIERKAAIRQKAMSAMQIAINTASAIMKIWAEVPKVDFGVSTGILTGIAAAMGAAQLAAVLAQPLPQARQGGLVQGPSHESGGVLINMEGDERIISQNPSKAFPELLNLISWIGKHSDIPDTRFGVSQIASGSSQQAKEMDYELLSDMIAKKMSKSIEGIKVYTSITDIREANENYSRIEESAKI